MTRIEKIKAMTAEQIAKVIEKRNITDEFCKGDCHADYGCPHPIECCIRWLKEEVPDNGSSNNAYDPADSLF